MSDKYAALRQEILNPAIGSRDHLRKIALQLLDELAEREAEREADKARIAELESRKVKLPGGYAVRSGHPINEGERGVLIPKDGGQWLPRFDVEHALHVAGITLETGV